MQLVEKVNLKELFLNNTGKIKPENRKIYEELHEYTLNTSLTQFSFHLPLVSSQEFKTDVFSVHWELAFQFIAAPASKKGRDFQQGSVEVEPVSWSLPIHVYNIDYIPELHALPASQYQFNILE